MSHPYEDLRATRIAEYCYDLSETELLAECKARGLDFDQDDDGNDIVPGREKLADWLADSIYWNDEYGW